MSIVNEEHDKEITCHFRHSASQLGLLGSSPSAKMKSRGWSGGREGQDEGKGAGGKVFKGNLLKRLRIGAGTRSQSRGGSVIVAMEQRPTTTKFSSCAWRNLRKFNRSNANSEHLHQPSIESKVVSGPIGRMLIRAAELRPLHALSRCGSCHSVPRFFLRSPNVLHRRTFVFEALTSPFSRKELKAAATGNPDLKAPYYLLYIGNTTE